MIFPGQINCADAGNLSHCLVRETAPVSAPDWVRHGES